MPSNSVLYIFIEEVGTSQKLLKILLKIPHQNMKLRLSVNLSHLHILNPLSSQKAGMTPASK